jgi:nucleoside 2-deoxyribosyltransferase
LTDVFISHSHANDVIAKTLQEFIFDLSPDPKIRVTCASDLDTGFGGGTNINEKIVKEIDGCTCLLALFTRNTKISSYVAFEIGIARGCGKPVIPILFSSSLKRSEIPQIVEGILYRDLTNIDDIIALAWDILKLTVYKRDQPQIDRVRRVAESLHSRLQGYLDKV